MDLELLDGALAARGQPAFRRRQIWEWAARGAQGFDEMTNVPGAIRDELAREVPFSTLSVEREVRSRDGTEKALFRTADGHAVEAVLMPFRDGRRSLCLSSQSGCPLTCTFCATGQMRFGRNLTASEILDQALHFRRLGPLTHAVFMGMGEPMLNLDPVVEAARRLPDLGIGHRRTTVSTVGWLPGLRRFVDEVAEPVRLALSLHAPEDALRSRIMPVNERFPLADVVAECVRYFGLRRRRVFVEYVMLAGVNDRVEQARALADLLDPAVFKVNLIPYNPIPQKKDEPGGGTTGAPTSNPTGMYEGSSRRAIAAFKAVLDDARLPATVRLTRGRDIAAACGQLAATR
jgi:23S rRNA (adenine2503-C2)-methyltransferase